MINLEKVVELLVDKVIEHKKNNLITCPICGKHYTIIDPQFRHDVLRLCIRNDILKYVALETKKSYKEADMHEYSITR